MISYRTMTNGDIPAGLSLCRSAGWNQTSEDWALFLKLSPKGCRVAIDSDGEVRGTVATVRYEDHFSWIGMVLVDPTMQRQGIGMQLLRESLEMLSQDQTVKLDATPAGRTVYVQLDFVDEYALTRMVVKEVSVNSLPESDGRPIQPADLPAIMELDRQVFGANRKPVLEAILQRGPQYGFLCEDRDGIKGYCFGRSGHNFTHIGPVISSDLQTATRLVSAALRNSAGRPVVLDAIHHTPEWMRWLTSIGFQEQRPLIRMYRGTNAHPGLPEKQFAILGPEFG